MDQKKVHALSRLYEDKDRLNELKAKEITIASHMNYPFVYVDGKDRDEIISIVEKRLDEKIKKLEKELRSDGE